MYIGTSSVRISAKTSSFFLSRPLLHHLTVDILLQCIVVLLFHQEPVLRDLLNILCQFDGVGENLHERDHGSSDEPDACSAPSPLKNTHTHI